VLEPFDGGDRETLAIAAVVRGYAGAATKAHSTPTTAAKSEDDPNGQVKGLNLSLPLSPDRP